MSEPGDEAAAAAGETGAHSWRDTLRSWLRVRVAAMLALGFSAGLPFLLVFSTLSAWLRAAEIDRTTIGLLSYVGLVYTIKFFWAPVVDRLPLPGLTRLLGRRRAWMLLAQCGIAGGLYGMAHCDPAVALTPLVLWTLLVAGSSATQDIVVDAWRIEAAPNEDQGTMAAAYQLGYRVGLIAATALALWLAGEQGWTVAYSTMALLALVGVATTLLIREPPSQASEQTVLREARVTDFVAKRPHWPAPLRSAMAWLVGAVLCPLLDFFQRNGVLYGGLILAFVGTFRLTDYTMGVMANPFYLDVGYTLQQIAIVAKGYGVLASVAGVLAGGVAVGKLGLRACLGVGLGLTIVTNLLFATLAWVNPEQPSLTALALVVSADNFAYNFAGTAFIAYLSGLTNIAYTATQYALFSSIFSLPGKLLMGASGWVVDSVGYPWFFVYTSLLGLPALAILMALRRAARNRASNGDQSSVSGFQ